MLKDSIQPAKNKLIMEMRCNYYNYNMFCKTVT